MVSPVGIFEGTIQNRRGDWLYIDFGDNAKWLNAKVFYFFPTNEIGQHMCSDVRHIIVLQLHLQKQRKWKRKKQKKRSHEIHNLNKDILAGNLDVKVLPAKKRRN